MPSPRPHVRIGSRGSQLALWQAQFLQRRLASQGCESTVEVIRTSGDRIQDRPLAEIGGKGLFTKEIEEALLAGSVDVAIHSLKDVPALLPEGLILSTILEREDPRDALIAAPGVTLATLPPGARVGSSSLRRQAQLLHLRPDLELVPLRGNVDTRLRKQAAGEFDAIVLAAAGLRRLERTEAISEWLDVERMCPAVGQGALALECRRDDAWTLALLAPLHDAAAAAAVAAERQLLRRLEAGCQAPVAAYAAPAQGEQQPANSQRTPPLNLRALVARPDGTRLLRAQAIAAAGETPEQLGDRVADLLLAQGAARLLADCAGTTAALPAPGAGGAGQA